MLPAGKRAVAVRITAEKTAGGLILPNDRVDVLHTLESGDKPEGQKDYTTRTILTNIVVLAVDQTLNETNKDEKGKARAVPIGKTVTLELDPRQAEVLVAAEASGTISLALRSAADNAEVAPPLKLAPLKVAAQPVAEPVVILRGGSGGAAAPKLP
jgi:pilus assembly protein CpaB